MADYFSPTVVQQTIPDADMTPLERLLLSRIFQYERDGDGWYFFAEERPETVVHATRAELQDALASSPDPESTAHRGVTACLAAVDDDEIEIEIDADTDFDETWERFFQDIVKRSRTLRYITVVTAFTCSKMRPDGFGGMAMLITPDDIIDKSTVDFLREAIAQAGLDDETPDAPPIAPPSE